jgi:hypothetical protein
MKAQQQIEQLRTLQESFDNLASSLEKLSNSSSAIALDKEVADGKQSLVDAIEYKGGESSAEKSLQGIAEDIKEIPNFNLVGIKYLEGYEPTSALESITNKNYITSIKDNNINQLEGHYLFYKCDYLEEVEMNKVESINGDSFFSHCFNLIKISFNSLISVTGTNTFSRVPAYIKSFPNLINFTIDMFSNIEKPNRVYAPKVQHLIHAFRRNRGLEWLEVGKLLSTEDISQYAYNYENLRNITIGVGTDINLLFNSWEATNVINEGQSGIDELNENLYNNLLTKLADHSTDGQTRTLRLGWLAHVTQENIDYANSKGWTLTT